MFDDKILSNALLKIKNKDKNLLEKPYNILKCYKYVGNGVQATTFHDKNKHIVYKLVPMDIKYYNNFTKDTPNDMKKKIEKHKLYFLKINKIIYHNKYLFIYTQRYSKCININDSSQYVFLSIILLVLYLINNHIMCDDISPHNITMYKENVLMFDYHGLHKLNIKDNIIKDSDWNIRLKKKLKNYCEINNSSLSLINIFDDTNINDIINNLKNYYNNCYNNYKNLLTSTQQKYLNLKLKTI